MASGSEEVSKVLFFESGVAPIGFFFGASGTCFLVAGLSLDEFLAEGGGICDDVLRGDSGAPLSGIVPFTGCFSFLFGELGKRFLSVGPPCIFLGGFVACFFLSEISEGCLVGTLFLSVGVAEVVEGRVGGGKFCFFVGSMQFAL